MEISELLAATVEKGASDLHLTVGRPPTLRLYGSLQHLGEAVLTPQDTEHYAKSIMSDEHFQKLQKTGSTDFGFAFQDKARFRVNVYKQKGCYGMALRQIPSKLLTLEEIGLPSVVKDILTQPRGLVLVTGPTGSGKTSTLSSMIDHINQSEDCHIITIEDPIEYYHTHKKSIITQRELGVDVSSFENGLRAALREDPDVILVGEMRDLETMEAAITAAETGHLVFGTLHTTGAARTMDRIIDAFPTTQQEQIRSQLSTAVLAVVSQMLLPRIDKKGRVAAFEIMITTPSIANLIREKKTFRITSDIQTGTKFGMITLDACLVNLYQKGMISYADMLMTAQDPESLARSVQKVG